MESCRLGACTDINPTILRVQLCQCARNRVACNHAAFYWESSDISPSLGGLEPPSSRLTAERASLLRHRDWQALHIKAHTCQMSGFTFYMDQAKTGLHLQEWQTWFSLPQRHSMFRNDCNFKQALTSSSETSFSNAT